MNLLDPQRYMDELVHWICESIEDGFVAFQVSFMFKPLFGNNSVNESLLLSSMSPGIYRFYSTLVTRFQRRPNQMPLDQMVRLIAGPDWPVGKNEKKTLDAIRAAEANGGLHYGGVLLAPPHARLKPDEVESHINGNRLYAGPGLSLERVFVERITETPVKATSYQFKSLVRLRSRPEDILVLPKEHSEMLGRSWLSRHIGSGENPNDLGGS